MQALLQSNARADAAESDGYDPARDHWSRFHGHKWLRDGEWLSLPTMVRLGVNVPLWLGLMAIGVMGMGTCWCRSAQSGWRCTCGELIALGVQRGT